MNLTKIIANHIIEIRYEDLSSETVEITKKLFLDAVACAVAGSSAEGSKELLDLVTAWAGKEESTILVYGGKVPAPHAALVNCTFARAWDLDDVHEAGGGHLSSTYVPAALILAEYSRKTVKGKDIILALALATDLASRLRCALSTFSGWVAQTFAPFGVVAMAHKLIGLTDEQLKNGMGLAYSQCSTNLQANVDGALSVRLQQGMGAKAGILSALLAERGFTGARDVFEGTYGFYPLYARNEYDPEVITAELGKRFETVNISIKPYPSCKQTHIPISGTVEIMEKHDIKPEDISKISIFTNSKGYNLAGKGEYKYYPRNVVDAQFSIPYTVATAAIKKKVFIEDLTDASLKNSDVLELARKVNVTVDPEIDRMPGVVVPNRIVLETNSGKSYSEYIEFVKGHPRNPMSFVECAEKFRACLPFSARPFSEDRIDRLIESVRDLEGIEDVGNVIQLLAVPT